MSPRSIEDRIPVEDENTVYAVLYGGLHHGEVLALPAAVYQLDIGERTYIARHVDKGTRTIVYVLHENGPADQTGPSLDGNGR